ncbi:NAD-dependent epimerase/dehydratase family protein [Mucilaginibacter aquatilis]|uniref:NAD-dependent epimerase/dehydratase family protein n=1 Tax=Mucilaginibacter aquatilis TaxID=1517760 RepID=A0A6I4IB66_9SPHI|nr:NAD-dependent epimerase/dehydratase family protein [Mucilaginibacter aquatilis]MVN92352.1 NAD-dependent epimerase/dehydratase family protein [Mucilaginibacter aquatilis]
MHIILGAGGPVANALTARLIKANNPVKLVSRRPVNFNNPLVTWQKADLLQANDVLQATKGATVIYMCAGLVYNKDIWKQQWPVIMQNIINAGKAANARLIFFDNVYMYGLVNGPMLETTPYNPVSVKGEVRAKVAEQLMDEAKAGNLQATIARAADFYGAESLNSFYDMMVLAKYAKKEKAMWMGNANTLHSFTYVPDAGEAMYLLGQHSKSDNQIWHLPTAKSLTGSQFIELAARVFNTKPRYMTVNKFMLQLMGLFSKTIQGTVEMYYQYDHDYIFNSDKFEEAFNVKPTGYEYGIKALTQTLFKSK